MIFLIRASESKEEEPLGRVWICRELNWEEEEDGSRGKKIECSSCWLGSP